MMTQQIPLLHLAVSFKNLELHMITLELQLLQEHNEAGITVRLRAHRDELIAIELELADSLQLASDGSLLSSPI